MLPGGLFITGTDTEVGKTYVAALLARTLRGAGLRVGVYKPAASGCRREGPELVSDDALLLWEAAGRPGTLDQVCPQRFAAPLAPSVAAAAEGRCVDERLLHEGLSAWSGCDVVLVEGAGGLFSPLSQRWLVADLALRLGYPLVVVARNALGTINHTLLTLHAAATYGTGLTVAAVVVNDGVPRRPAAGTTPAAAATGAGTAPHIVDDDPSRASNVDQLRHWCRLENVTCLARGGSQFVPAVDWLALARRS
jgi:dethiobiotin synthetase